MGLGGNILDYVILVVPYTSGRVWGHAPRNLLVFLCSETASGAICGKHLLNSCFIDKDEPS